ncbi:hypothetical protein G7067_00035 [Leucobacter insecticola]|uniref:Uncharacterized protein n=1 Tax=Leucobacter insecticola TaxID=2714934 RepID=A0A6G8FFN0_9MICO|nr:hypothetical protein [Leucobacter insecticola]QIM15171.1 hypothetical protein G7067_00035 [Leucobacter insecticola]
MMKFGKRVAAFAAAVVLMLGGGATASNAALADGFRVETVVSGVNVARDLLRTSDFQVAPTDRGFEFQITAARAAWKAPELHLGVYPIDQAFDSATFRAGTPSLVAGVPSAEDAMLRFNEALSGQKLVDPVHFAATVDFPVTGPYTVMLFSSFGGEVWLVGGAKVNTSEVTVLEPSYDSATSTLTIPDAAGQYRYVDTTGTEWAPRDRPYILDESLTLRAEADLNRGYVLPAGTWEWTYTVDVKTPTVTPPVTPPVPPAPPVAGPGTPGISAGTAPGEDRLLPEFEGKIGAPATAVPGGPVTILVGTEFAGKEIDVYVYSDPVFLGRHAVSADGTVTVSLPNGLVGEHRLAVYSGGDLIGWNRIVIEDSAGSGSGFVVGTVSEPALATTGSGSLESSTLLAIASVVLGAAIVGTRRRSRRSRA